MNLALLDPFELHNEQPEVIEDRISVDDGVIVVCEFNRRGNLLACGCKEGLVAVCDFDTHGITRTLRRHTSRITAVSWTRSSRRLLSSSYDGLLVQWDVLTAEALVAIHFGCEVAHAAMHPRKKRMCLVCTAEAGAACPAFLQMWEPENRLPLLAQEGAAEAEATAGGGGSSKRGDSSLLAKAACFDKEGGRVLIGTNKGVVHIVATESRELLISLPVPGAAAVKSIMLSRNGTSFLLKSNDRFIRVYQLDRVLAGESPPPRQLQEKVDNLAWAHADFSASEHVIGTAYNKDSIFIWDVHGHLETILYGPKDGPLYFACHPTRPILACCAKSGVVYVWTKRYSENWSAFAPDFKELEENEEYEEREDEFDIQPQQEVMEEEEIDELIDVVTIEPSELAHTPDADDSDQELLFLPIVLEPDEMMDEEQGSIGGPADEAMAIDDKQAKARKRMRLSDDGRR